MSQEQETPDSKAKMDFQTRFNFQCHPGVKCFTTCCSDVTIFLTPYDVLRLKNRLGLTSAEFMDQYTILLTKEKQVIPLVVLKMSDNDQKSCQLVSEKGCTVYEDRPWACRMYPLDVDEEEKFSIIAKPEKCRGLEEDNEIRVIEWLEDQGIMDYQRVNNYYSEIICHPKLKEMDVTNDQVRQMFYMAAYNLDSFRDFVMNSKFMNLFEFEDDFMERIRVDDTELLRLGLDWIKFGLFGEKTLKVKPEVLEAKQRAMADKNKAPGS